MTLPPDIVVTPIRVIFTIFAIFAWSRAYLRWQERLFNLKEFAFWTFIWAGLIFLIFTPGKADFIAEWLGVGRGTDAVFAIGLVLILYMVYRLYAKVDKLEQNLAKIIQHLALTRGKRTRIDS